MRFCSPRIVASVTLATFAIPSFASAQLIPIEFRTINGQYNNANHEWWGGADTQLRRESSPAYGDQMNTPAGSTRPSARQISNVLSKQSVSMPSRQGLTDMVWAFGQFLSHDLDLSEAHVPTESFPIAIPTGDPDFDPQSVGGKTIRISRSVYDLATGTATNNPRQQLNEVTSFLDASQVYGSDTARAAALRTFQGGKLQVSEGNLLPFNTAGFPNELVGTNPAFFLTGDIRANEHVGLSSLHILFLREHNRLADEIAARSPELSDEMIYQEARKLVGAQLQAIALYEYLPILTGRMMPAYRTYDPSLDPSISNAFATAGFRLHSMVSNQLLRLNDDGTPHTSGPLTLRQASRAPQLIVATGIDPIVRGLFTQIQQESDLKTIDNLRTILFGNSPAAGGTDVIAADIQRGRDHGLPDYNTLRAAYGLPRYTRFSQITRNNETATGLASLYSSIDDIDPFVGMMAEDPVPNGSVGPLVAAILTDQFMRLRDGDRFWFERSFPRATATQIRQTRLSDIIRRNTILTTIPRDVFHNYASMTRNRLLGFPGL